MSRVLAIELRRSAAIGSALTLAVVGVLALYFAEGIGFTDGWMQLAMSQRLFLALLWPLALAAGAWQGRREHRWKVTELFASTPRPVAQRNLPTLAVMAAAVTCAYLVMGAAGGAWIIGTAEYLPAQVFVVTAVGVLALLAAIGVGLAIGRLLPWLVVAPALAIAGLGLLLTIPGATRPRGWLALVFSPIYEMNMPDAFATVPGRVSASQAIWLAALTATGVLVFLASTWRLRVAALVPVLLGAALAIPVMPHEKRVVLSASDPVAKELVCDGAVCLSRVHGGLLPSVLPDARKALTVLAELPDGPTRLHEDTTTYVPDVYPPWDPGVVLLRVDTGQDAQLAEADTIVENAVAAAFAGPPGCENSPSPEDRLAAAHWLIGTEPSSPEAAAVWSHLEGMPEAEAQGKVVTLRAAAVKCAPGASLS
ncbi:hypothetical protein ACTI_67760 [Actinoplanes sp. OR16]|uniref:hypothetical protein n=1 Tax=Actinoplanes sp. OR16 TaxID=946334 RepID=UPI000F6E0A71|nr:hypothetical protein [Actinoplanes sp. OR16]BBH70091.1 hypothetical protein ACTI_67760 [Actinoplanes sp. OR16]